MELKLKQIRRRWNVPALVTYTLLALACVATLYPFWYVFMYALSTSSEVLGARVLLFPKGFTMEHILYVMQSPQIVTAYFNTIFVVVVGTVGSMAVTTMFAYGLRQKVLGHKWIALFVYFAILFRGGIVPTYLVVRATGLLNSLWSLIIPQLVHPFYVLIMRSFFRSIPDSLIESAEIDGAKVLTILARIVIPVSMPAIATLTLFYGVRYWNAYFEAVIYMSDQAKWTIQVVLRDLLITQSPEMGSPSGEMTASAAVAETVKMATVVVSVVPIMMIYPFLQKHFVKGALLGAVKG
jgi:putative aldouronate transport system permease protein